MKIDESEKTMKINKGWFKKGHKSYVYKGMNKGKPGYWKGNRSTI